MRRLAEIVVSLTTLVLLVFGAGGVSIGRCACSGSTELLSLSDDDCCPKESSCMTVVSLLPTTGENNSPTVLPHPQPATATSNVALVGQIRNVAERQAVLLLSDEAPPHVVSTAKVLRV